MFFPDWIRKIESAKAGAAVQLVAVNFAGCEKLLLDAQVQFLLTHYHPSLVSRLDSERYQCFELDTDVLVPISAPARSGARKRTGRQDRPGGKPRFALPGAAGQPLPYLSYHPGSGVGRIVSAFLAAKHPAAALAPTFSAPVMLLIDMARQGPGLTWAPRNLVADDLLSGRLLRAGSEEWDIESASACSAPAPA